MKIGIDARFLGPESKGLGRYTQKLIEHLEQIDHVNQYVIFLRAENYEHYKPQNKNFKKVIADYQWYTLSEQLFLPRVLKKEKCDFIHFPHFNVPLLYRGKFLVTIHDLILLRFPTQKASTHSAFFYWLKFLAYKIVISSAIARAKHIFAVSRFTADDVTAHYPHAIGKISVTHEASHDVRTLQKTTPELERDPYLLYVGNAYPHKNLSFLVRAFKEFTESTQKRYKLILVGRKDYFYDRLQDEIIDLEIENIVIKDTVSDEELAQLYSGADAFLFPSLYEGFGLPPLEAMAHSVPVISHDHPCMREILGDAALYANARELPDFVYAMRQITSDGTLRAHLVAKGRIQSQKYSWQSTAKATFAVYQMLGHAKMKA